MKKTIAIIGATTQTGTAVAKQLLPGPWHLLLLDDDPALLEQLLNQLRAVMPENDAEVLHCMVDACWEADIILLATLINKQNEIPVKLREVATGKTVISMVHSDDEITLEELNTQLPYSKVESLPSSSLQELVIHLNKI